MEEKANNDYDYFYKCVLIGDPSTKKSQILNTLKRESAARQDTIGVDFVTHVTRHNDKQVKLQIWDTAGQERFINMTRVYFRSAQIFVCAFSLLDDMSFTRLPMWLKEIKNSKPEDSVVILVGTGMQHPQNRQISEEQAREFAASENLEYLEVEISNYDSVIRIFRTGLELLIKNQPQNGPSYQENVEIFLTSCYQHLDNISEYTECLKKLNAKIVDVRHSEHRDLLPKCYGVKLMLLEKTLALAETPAEFGYFFVDYLDALGGIMHYSDKSTAAVLELHLNLYLQLLEKIDHRLELQATVIANLKSFHSNVTSVCFPNDDTFLPLIIGKLATWMSRISPIENLRTIKFFPCIGLVQQMAEQYISDIIPLMRRVENIDDILAVLVDYFEIQKSPTLEPRMLTVFLAALQTQKNHTIIYKLAQLFQQILNSNKHGLIQQFMSELVSAKNPNELDAEYALRLALAEFLVQHFELASFEPHGFIAETRQPLQRLEQDYLLCMLDLTCAQLKSSKPIEIQWAIDLLTQFQLMQITGVPLVQHAELDLVVEKICRTLFRFIKQEALASKSDAKAPITEINNNNNVPIVARPEEDVIQNDAFDRLCMMLSSFAFTHLSHNAFREEYLKIQAIDTPLAQHITGVLEGGILAPISAAETYEHYLKRLATVCALHELGNLASELKLQRLVNLVVALKIVDLAPANVPLTERDFSYPYNPNHESLISLLADNPSHHLRALCAIYLEIRDKTYHSEFIIALISQYLLAQGSAITTHPDVVKVITDIFNYENPLYYRNLHALMDSLSDAQIAALVTCQFEAINTYFSFIMLGHIALIPSDESYIKIGTALCKENKHLEFLNAILKSNSPLTNTNIIFKICAAIIEAMPKDKINFDMIINFLRTTLNQFANHGCARFNDAKYSARKLFPLLLAPLSEHGEFYQNEICPLLSEGIFKILTSASLKKTVVGKSPFKYSDITDTVLCFLEHGTSLVTMQTIEFEGGRKGTNALLYLINERHFSVLKNICEFYRKNPKAIIDTTLGNEFFNQSPLFLAMNRGADYELTMLMLELGFSQSTVDHYLSEKRKPSEIETAAGLRSNAPAIRALHAFNRNIIAEQQRELEKLRAALRQQEAPQPVARVASLMTLGGIASEPEKIDERSLVIESKTQQIKKI